MICSEGSQQRGELLQYLLVVLYTCKKMLNEFLSDMYYDDIRCDILYRVGEATVFSKTYCFFSFIERYFKVMGYFVLLNLHFWHRVIMYFHYTELNVMNIQTVLLNQCLQSSYDMIFSIYIFPVL